MEANYTVPEANLEVLKQRIAKLARRCNRIKVAPPVLTVGQPEDIRYTHEDATGYRTQRVRRVFPVTLDSPERPKIDGFEFAAVISPVTDEDGNNLGNILRMVPGFDTQLPERFRSATNQCDHCNQDRRRLETFVIRDSRTPNAGFKQVGRNCLANYLGLTNPHMLAELAQILIDARDLVGMAEEDDCFGGGSRVAERFPIDSILEVAASAIRQNGWLSNKSAREFDKMSTSMLVQEWVMGNKETRERFEHPLTVSEGDKALASETEAWLEGLSVHTNNDYLYNLALIASASSVTGKNFGLLVSAINAYSKDKEREIRRNKRIEDDSKSVYVGTVGERVTLNNLTVVYTTTFESEYGSTQFYKMKDGDGNVIVYFSSRVMQLNNQDFAIGTVIPALVARIKKHELRESVKQTNITRASFPARELSKDDKKAINKLKRILKTVEHNVEETPEFNQEQYLTRETVYGIIESIKRGE